MKLSVYDKLLRIYQEIHLKGNAPLDRLDILEPWLASPLRLRAFAVVVAGRAAGKKGKTNGVAGELFQEAASLLCARYQEAMRNPQLDRSLTEGLHDRLHELRLHESRLSGSKPNRNLLIVEEGLAIYLWHNNDPARGCKLAIDYCLNRDPHYGIGLNGPSATKIMDLARFVSTIEGYEEFYSG
jgi:hypothetical protein